MTVSVGSLFSGIGGFDLGFERAGMDVRWQCEIDKAARDVLRRHWPNATLYEDVRNVGIGTEPVDVVCGGFPCQDVSVAGRRAGLAGERSGLWYEFHRILGELTPEWVVIENVPGLLSSNDGRDFAVILRGLVECGYGVVWRILDSQHFGVPQRRRRVFIVGHLGDGRAAEVLFERESGAGNPEPGSSARQGITASPEGIAGTVSSKWAKGTGGPSGDEAYNLIAFYPGALSTSGSLSEHPSLSPTLRANGSGMNAAVHLAADFRNETIDATAPTLLSGYDQNGGIGLIARALTASGNNKHDESRETLVVGTLYASGAGTSRTASAGNESDFIVGSRPRRLTPTECARLQGFPDDWNAWLSDAARYRQYGNAVTVNVAEWIGRRIVGGQS